MTSRYRAGAVLACALTVGLAHGATPQNDPKVGRGSYFGTGSAERAPEFAEVQIQLNVQCRKSAEDVAKAIDAESAPLWKAIVAKVPTDKFTETDRTYWTSIAVTESEGSRIDVRPPTKDHVGSPPKRIDVCTGKALPLDAEVPAVYSGIQRIGVRSADLDWVEALARALNERPDAQGKTAVKVTHGGVQYDIKAETKRALYEEVLGKAREAATGPGSQFESDKKTLKFESAHFLGHRLAFNNASRVQVGDAVAKGKAPKVTLELPLVYTVYAEAADVVAGKETKGLETAYEIQGTATVDADYASTNLAVSVNCQPKKESATEAIVGPSKAILNQLVAFQGDRKPTETDKLVDNEATAPSPYYPYLPIGWADEGKKVTDYLDLCTQKTVPAADSGNLQDLPAYFRASHGFELRSSRFDALVTLVDALREKHVRPSSAGSVKVSVSNATAQVVEATKQKLVIAAREQATKGILDRKGPLAADVAAHKFLLAHLKSVRPGTLRPQGPGGPAFGAAAPMAPESAGLQSGAVVITPVVKPNERRPTYPLTASYLFEYEFRTANYVEELQPKKLPARLPAPTLPDPLFLP